MSVVRKIRNGIKFFSDWRSLSFFIQRGVTRPVSRARVASWIARRRPPVVHGTWLDPHKSAELLARGITHLGQLLSHDEVIEIRNWLMDRQVVDDYRPEVPPFLPLGDGRHPDSHVAYHRPEDVVSAPHLLALANRPEILALAENFLGCRPTIGYLAAWWSYATQVGPQQAENFHRDVDDWRFLKLFVFLSDVGDENGPHIYVQHSAQSDQLTQIRRYDDGEIAATFGAQNIVVNCGAAGSGFLENTFGFHKGQPVKSGTRLMFQAVYSLNPLPYGPRRAVMRFPGGISNQAMELDAWSNRVYLKT